MGRATARASAGARGWRIDYVEKVPTAQSCGVQLYKYKLIISR